MKETSSNTKTKVMLREKYLSGDISDGELFEFFLTYARFDGDVKEVAERLKKNFSDNYYLIFNADVEELCKVEGVTKSSAVLIKLVGDVKAKIAADRNKGIKEINDVETAKTYVKNMLENHKNERIIAVALDSKNRILKCAQFGEGTVNNADLEPLNLFKCAIECESEVLLLAHNHPKGSSNPSNADVNFTKNLIKISKGLGIEIKDHLIVGENDVFSMRENKELSKIFI